MSTQNTCCYYTFRQTGQNNDDKTNMLPGHVLDQGGEGVQGVGAWHRQYGHMLYRKHYTG